MAGICGRPRADGQPCQRPPGCRIPHTRINDAAAAAKSLTTPSPISDSDFVQFPDRVHDLVLSPLANEGGAYGDNDEDILVPPALEGDYLTADRLMADVLERGMLDGFTLSPHGAHDDYPPDGCHAVAIPGTDLPLPHDPWLLGGHSPSENTLRVIREWLRRMMPALNSGHAWVGGFLHGEDDEDERAGRFEINVTVLFLPEHRDEALSCCTHWDQKSMWTFDKNHKYRGYETPTGGEGGGSVFTDPDASDHLGQPRTSLKEMLEPKPRRRRRQLWKRQ